MATLEKRGVVGILCTVGDKILPPEVPAIACVACTTESWTIEAVVGTWADTMVDVDAALVDVVTDGGGRSASWTDGLLDSQRKGTGQRCNVYLHRAVLLIRGTI